jgi:thimet oligopeptidase
MFNYKSHYLCVGTICGILGIFLYVCTSLSLAKQTDLSMITNKQDVSSLFSMTASQLTARVEAAMRTAQKQIDAIIALPAEKRSYETVAYALDKITSLSDVAILLGVCSCLEYVTPDDALRQAAHTAVTRMQDFLVDAIEDNKTLYQVFKEYVETIAPGEQLTAQQQYYLQETIKQWQRQGFDLPDEQRARCSALKKEIAKLSQDFEAHIAQDNRTITVPVDDLAGVNADFIAGLKRDAAGNCILGVDYPTVFTILDTCSVESTRKALYSAFNNRAHPVNQAVLEQLIAARDELAGLLGMSHYNELCLVDEMVETADRALLFLQKLVAASRPKQQKEFQALVATMPADTTLTADGKIKPWDLAYIKNNYKKQHFNLDEELIAQYFPMQSTVDGLLHIYEQFFNLKFERISLTGLWHPEVTMLVVHDGTTQEILGYLLLDLHPRAHKYTHACHMTIVPSVVRYESAHMPSVSVVLANFPQETATKPALLKRADVNTFFHEFGHALHAILGRTQVASFAGTNVKRDFVELPSQMLEEWLWDANILKMISKHYLTGEPLSDELISKIQASKTFDSGYHIQRQAFLALASLAFYDKGRAKDIKKIWQTLLTTIVPDIAHDPDMHMYLSFGHLPGYGPRYYGYLWSKVFALDIFETIKKEGLLNPAAGKRYVDAVISHGGSKNPNDLLQDYLGRQPRQDAFLADQGLL